jgi:hypothetical protein
MTVRLQANAHGFLEVISPFNRAFLDEFKATTKPNERSWDQSKKVWVIAPEAGDHVADLLRKHYGQDVNVLTQATLLPTTVTRKIRLEYLGQCKERPGYEGKSAFGYADGQWSIVIPETVLRDFFAGGNGPETLYSVLGVHESASLDEIKSGHRRAARSFHPDVCTEPNAAEMFQAIQSAWEILRDPQQKKKYDAGLYFERSLTHQSLAHSRWENYVSPYRCGVLNVTGAYKLNRLCVEQIHDWKEIVRADGAVMVSSWPKGGDHFVINWVTI